MARGSILRRKRESGNVYVVRVDLGADPVTGKRRQVSETKRTRKEAEKRLAEWLNQIERGTAVNPDTITVGELMQTWLDDVVTHKVAPTTLAGYRWQVKNHIVPGLGSVRVQKLTAPTIQAFYAQLLRSGVTPHTARLCHMRLHAALEQAVRWTIIPSNPAKSAEPPRHKTQAGKTWSRAEVDAFLTSNERQPFAAYWHLLLTTGLRRGEGLGLRWRDLDLDRGTLTVRQSVAAMAGGVIIQAPKTQSSKRTIRLDPETIEVLRAHRTEWLQLKLASPADAWQDTDLVFSDETGGAFNPYNLPYRFKLAIARAKVPSIRIHDLRHTHATLLLLKGIDIKVVSERLGHANISVTIQTYQHVLPEMQDRAVDAITEIFGRSARAQYRGDSVVS